jgi:hypothetical protein
MRFRHASLGANLLQQFLLPFVKLKNNNDKIRIFAKKHAKVRRISETPLPFYAYLT